MYTVLVERDYKGTYERFALTLKEFEDKAKKLNKDSYGDCGAISLADVIEGNSSYTIAPLVHIWCIATEVNSVLWNDFFTDMELGLPESDIENGNLAYIRYDLAESLRNILPR